MSLRERRTPAAEVPTSELLIQRERRYAEKARAQQDTAAPRRSRLVSDFSSSVRWLLQSAALKRAVVRHKQATALSGHQLEWQQLQHRLQAQRRRAEAELLSSLQSLAASATDSDVDGSCPDIHSLGKEMQAVLDESREEEAAGDDWLQQMQRPRLTAEQLLRELTALRQAGEKGTRLQAQRREDEREKKSSALRSLMPGLQHQRQVFAQQLQQQQDELEAELQRCDAGWLWRMADGAEDEQPQSVQPSALHVNPLWMESLSAEARAEVEAERSRRTAAMQQQLELAQRKHAHRLSELHQDMQAFTAALTIATQAAPQEREDTALAADNAAPSHCGAARDGRRTAGVSRGQEGWKATDEMRLQHLHRAYQSSGKQSRLLHRLRLEFPQTAADELRQRLELHVKRRFCNEQRSAALAGLHELQSSCRLEAQQAWAAAINRLKLRWKQEAERRVRETEAEQLRLQLGRMQQAKEDEEQRQRAQLQAARLEQEHREAAQAEEERARREEDRRRLQSHEQALRRESEKAQQQAERERQHEQAERQQQQRLNAERLAFRQSEQAHRAALRQRQLQQADDERRRQQQRLQALAETVQPQHVQHSTQRLLSQTVASSPSQAEDGSSSPPLFRVNGYSNDAVFADPRARLSTALHQAGISAATNSYAQQLLARTGSGVRVMRKDLNCSLTD